MNLLELATKIELSPTLMGVEEELYYINHLIMVDSSKLYEMRDEFFRVLDRLDESHSSDTYLEVDDGNKDPFFDFAKWLIVLSQSELFREYDEDLEAYAETFMLLPSRIYGE